MANNDLLVTRMLALQAAVPAERMEALRAAMTQVPGIRQVNGQQDGKRLLVTYDRGWLGFNDLAEAFSNAGYALASRGWMGIKSMWYARQDRKVRVVGRLPESACCGQPPDLSGEKDR